MVTSTHTITVQPKASFNKQASLATVQAIANTAAALPQHEASQLMTFAKFLMEQNIKQYREWKESTTKSE